jgi:hypothetical protein
MSHQQYRQGEHRLNEFVPNYVPHSDYLTTNRVVDSNQGDVQRWVRPKLFSFQATRNKKDKGMFTPSDPKDSTPSAMSQFAPTKM